MDFISERNKKLKILYKKLNWIIILFSLIGFIVSIKIEHYIVAKILAVAILYFTLGLKFTILTKYNNFVAGAGVFMGSIYTPGTFFEILFITVIVGSMVTYKKESYAFISAIITGIAFLYISIIKSGLEPVPYFSEQRLRELEITNIGITIFGIIGVLSIFRIINRDYEKTIFNQKKDIEDKNKEIIKQSEIILEQQKEKHDLELKQKQKDLDMVNSNNMMKFIIKKQLIENLQNLSKSPEIAKDLKQLIIHLKAQEETEEKINFAHQNIEEINSIFFDRLLEKFPKLSRTDRELCTYFKLGLSAKEIAELRKTTENSINVAKTRLRKKLGLSNNSELIPFLIKF